jgi:hypothetical protein
VNLQHPLLLLLISPLLLAGFYALRRGVNKTLVITRVIVLSLLIIALSNPYIIATHTIRDDAPMVTLIADKTISCDVYDTEEGKSLQEYLKTRTPTEYREITGIKTALGNEILKNSALGRHIILVSDLNNNHGADLRDAIILARNTGAHVYAVRQTPIHSDTGIEIVGSKNIIVGVENTYHIIIRHVGEETTYTLRVEADGAPLLEETITQSEHEKIIPLPYTPPTEGVHRITATITPLGEDRFALNNVFYKSVFAAPKPRVLYVGEDSPLKTVLTSLYEVSEASTLENVNFSEYKAIIIDNKPAGAVPAQKLRDYVAAGGALLTVGGDESYDRGDYNNSEFEKILPVLSRPSKYKGGRNVVIVIDASGSTDVVMYDDIRFIGHMDALAQNIVNNKNIGSETKIGVIAFGSSAEKIDFLSATPENKKILREKIATIGPESGAIPTNMDRGLKAAGEMLQNVSGVKIVVVLSDGNIRENRNAIEAAARELVEDGINLYFRQVGVGKEETFKTMGEIANSVGADYQYIGTSELNIQFEPLPEVPEEEEKILRQFGLTITDGEHFITQYLNLSGDLTGFNDVTPKLGARRLVATVAGKPVLTVWNFGLGRTAALTTDDGNGWAGVLYTNPNSKLISATVNWLIGDPRPSESITAPDVWLGTPGRVTIKTTSLPRATLDGEALSFTKQDDHYTAVIEPKTAGYHSIDGYEVAANYPLEYREIGFNEEMAAVITAYNGSVHPYEEAKSLLLADIKANSVRTVNEPVSAKMPFIIAAIIVFLGEVIHRRIRMRRS